MPAVGFSISISTSARSNSLCSARRTSSAPVAASPTTSISGLRAEDGAQILAEQIEILGNQNAHGLSFFLSALTRIVAGKQDQKRRTLSGARFLPAGFSSGHGRWCAHDTGPCPSWCCCFWRSKRDRRFFSAPPGKCPRPGPEPQSPSKGAPCGWRR